MYSHAVTEKLILDQFEPEWTARGYTLIREPNDSDLPEFLMGFKPDAIAIGKAPSLVIEIRKERSPENEMRVKQIKKLFDGQKDWALEIIYGSQNQEIMKTVSTNEIKEALQKAQLLAKTEPRAGLLLAWATLEAATRALEPKLAAQALPSNGVVNTLISNGHIEQVGGRELRRLGSLRNAIIHGQINTLPSQTDVEYLIKTGERLVS